MSDGVPRRTVLVLLLVVTLLSAGVGAGFFAGLLAIWQALVASGLWSPVLLASPGSVARYLWHASSDGTLGAAMLVTMRRLVVGYVAGIAIGIPGISIFDVTSHSSSLP